jgi:UDP-glucose 4-epimerase
MDILITGAGGYLGSHLVKELKGLDNIIYCLDKRVPPNGENIIPIKGDLLQWQNWADTLENVSIIIHLAAQVDVMSSWANPAEDLVVNGIGTVKMLECAKYIGAKYIIYTSSAAVYGKKAKPVTERDVLNPTCPYGLSKMIGEDYINFFKFEMGLKCLTLRISNIYGEDSRGVISTFAENIRTNQPLVLNGTGKQVRDFIHISDVTNAIIQCMEQRIEGVYNLSTGKGHSLLDIIEAFRSKFKKIKVENIPPQKGEVFFSVLENTKLKSKIDWEPKRDVKEYIRKL